ENTIVARGLRFGAGVDSPNAVSLPLELAASLLRDQSGVIHIDFPVRGNLNQPQFSFGSLFLRALTNVLTSVVTAPFNLFAAIAGSSRNLDRCHFAFGEAELGAEEQLRLGDLAKALLERPAVSLAIAPLYDPVHDKLALAEKYRKSRKKEDNGDDAAKNGERDVLLEEIIIPESELTALAKERALSVQRYLESKGISASRLAIREPSAQKVESAQIFVPLTVSGQ
ncbi:MAG TPA: hypothetical protein PLP17_17760, partial [Oligoflexia bacterium]|nr:hypothetical protein [Oligoflexia bacterium]